MNHRGKVRIETESSRRLISSGFEPIESELYNIEYDLRKNKFFVHGIFRESKTKIVRNMCEYIDIENITAFLDQIDIEIEWKKINHNDQNKKDI
jgi:hypothetical protein